MELEITDCKDESTIQTFFYYLSYSGARKAFHKIMQLPWSATSHQVVEKQEAAITTSHNTTQSLAASHRTFSSIMTSL